MAKISLKDCTEKARMQFKRFMVNYPCTFNLGTCNYKLESNVPSLTFELIEPHFDVSNCRRLEHELRVASDDEEFEEIIWKENLLTRVLYERHKKQEAVELNKKIIRYTKNENLTALANSAFLNFYQEETEQLDQVKKRLEELMRSNQFQDLKLQAIVEQAYAHRKLGGNSNLLCAIQLLSSLSDAFPEDEKVKFLLALVYRRCTSLMMLVDNPRKVARRELAKEAANRLRELGTTAKNKSIKAAAIAELAFLRRSDVLKEFRLIDSLQWEVLIDNLSWKELCFKALQVDEDNPHDRVLKMVGQMFKSDIKTREHAITLLNKSIAINPSSRSYHHLGLIYVKKAVAYEKEKLRMPNQKQSQSQKQPKSQNLLFGTSRSLGERLSCNLKVLRRRIPPFSPDNPHVDKAEEYLREAVKVSFKVSIAAQYDLAFFLARQCKYAEAKRICKEVIDIFTESPSGFQRHLHLVNIYNLYGMCYVLEAEEAEDEEMKKVLLDRSEDILLYAIHLATKIAASVPELKRCGIDVWQAFNQLQTKFSFSGDPESKRKMCKLCELVADYSWLPEVNEMLSIGNAEWQDKNFLETYLKKYIQEKDFDKADQFLNLLALRPNSLILTINNSQTVKQLRFEQVRQVTERAIKGENFPDPIWKKIMDEVYLKSISDNSSIDLKAFSASSQDGANTTSSQHGTSTISSQDGANTICTQDGTNTTITQVEQNDTKILDLLDILGTTIDVLLVQNIDSSQDDEDGIWSCKASDCIKKGLRDICGLNVEKSCSLRRGGVFDLVTDVSNIRQSKVVIFFFDRSETVAKVKANQVLKNESISHPSLTSSNGTQKSEQIVAKSKNPNSPLFENLLVHAIHSMIQDECPGRIVMAIQSDKDKSLIPDIALGKPVLVISEKDISVLDSTASEDLAHQYELIINIFKQLVCKGIMDPSPNGQLNNNND